MKVISKLFTALIAVVMLASCGSENKKYESKYFSVMIPDGMEVVEPDEAILETIPNVIIQNNEKTEMAALVMFPFKVDPKAMLMSQTVGGMNPALIGMTFGEMTAVTIDGIEGWKVAMSGVMAGQIAGEGEVFCADIDNACVIAFTAGKDAVPSFTDKFIGSIQVNKEAVDAIQADPVKAIETVVDLTRANLPMPIDEITTWRAINVDNDAKNVNVVMSLNGNVSDFEGIANIIEANRESVVRTLRSSIDSDLTLSVPVSYGYSITYQYVPSNSDEPVATLTITPDELK